MTVRELPLQGKVQKRIVRPAARGNAGSGCCQWKQGHNPAKMAPFFAATDICERCKNGIQDITPYVPMAAKANPADEIETCVNCRASEAGNLGVRTGRQTQ
jgi:hypothetical protein